MTDTYAQVMRPADEPEARRTTRSRAPGRSSALRDPSAAVGSAGVAGDSLPTPIGASRKPAGKPRTPRTSAKKPGTPGTGGEASAPTAPPAGPDTPQPPLT